MATSMEEGFHIIQCKSPVEFELVNKIALELGINCIENFIEEVFSIDPEGFFMGIIYNPTTMRYDQVGCIMALNYGGVCGVFGLYMVREPYKGKGYGPALTNAAREHVKNCITKGTDAIPIMVKQCEDQGEKPVGKTLRKQFIITEELHYFIEQYMEDDNLELRNVKKEEFDKIAEYDKKSLGVDRKAFLSKWFFASAKTLACAAFHKDGSVTGYGVLKKCTKGYKIGPVVAENGRIARLILRYLIIRLPIGEQVNVDVNGLNIDAMNIFTKEIKGRNRPECDWFFDNGLPPGLDVKKLFIRTDYSIGY